MSFDLSGRVVAVTGGGSGIGAACARLAAQCGAAVMVGDVSSDAASSVAKEIQAAGGRALAIAFDVRNSAAVTEAFDRAVGELGPIDGLVAAAGVGGAASSESMSLETWQKVIDTNLTGLFLCVQAAGHSMLSHGRGSIVAIGSGAGLSGLPERTHYSASKHGVNGIVRSLAAEWGPRGVRVNCVAPGPVDTPLLRKNYSAEQIDRIYVRKIPLRRLSTAEDQARAAMFLLSDAADYITGVVLPVSGGLFG